MSQECFELEFGRNVDQIIAFRHLANIIAQSLCDSQTRQIIRSRLTHKDIKLGEWYETSVEEGDVVVIPFEKLPLSKPSKHYLFRCQRLVDGQELTRPKRAQDLKIIEK